MATGKEHKRAEGADELHCADAVAFQPPQYHSYIILSSLRWNYSCLPFLISDVSLAR